MRCDVAAAGRPADEVGVAAGTACPVQEARRVLWAAARGSCGRETFCREGTRQVATILDDVVAGKGAGADLALVDELCGLVADHAPCPLAAGAARTALDLLRTQEEEWERHVRRGRCTSLTCAMAFTVHVDPAACTGCEACVPGCPAGAIAGGPGLIHVVTDACTRCEACLPVCPVGALVKAGFGKPRTPAEPVPVGSFTTTPAGGMRRRRRPT